jgi:hypothetical protein
MNLEYEKSRETFFILYVPMEDCVGFGPRSSISPESKSWTEKPNAPALLYVETAAYSCLMPSIHSVWENWADRFPENTSREGFNQAEDASSVFDTPAPPRAAIRATGGMRKKERPV